MGVTCRAISDIYLLCGAGGGDCKTISTHRGHDADLSRRERHLLTTDLASWRSAAAASLHTCATLPHPLPTGHMNA